MLRHFISKIKQRDNAMAMQLESRTVKVVSERVIFENPRNDAKKVTVQEIECDHTCTWAAAVVARRHAWWPAFSHMPPHIQIGDELQRGDQFAVTFLDTMELGYLGWR